MDDPIPNGGEEELPPNVHSITDRAAEGEEEQIEFPTGVIDAGASKKSLKNLIKAGLPVEMTVSMMRAEVPLRGGIPDPEGQHRFLVTTELAKVEPVVQREDGKVVSWKLRAHLRPVYVEVVEAQQADAGSG